MSALELLERDLSDALTVLGLREDDMRRAAAAHKKAQDKANELGLRIDLMKALASDDLYGALHKAGIL